VRKPFLSSRSPKSGMRRMSLARHQQLIAPQSKCGSGTDVQKFSQAQQGKKGGQVASERDLPHHAMQRQLLLMSIGVALEALQS
jgi:hypothetical protein